ncbi:Mu transposase domain-containing protein [Bradyrhizobium sp. McL0616]|uniref:Mu transposase domain-containing protein n=1 Tax=Bradyrhizobium sp. McL0616 TaxID=3415674 RepID=UPI003CFA7E5B
MPDEPYQYAEWKRCRVNLDYHIEIAKHYYSVPHNLVRQEVETRVTQKTVEIFLRQAGGVASAQHPAASPDDDCRAYAELASSLSRLDA